MKAKKKKRRVPDYIWPNIYIPEKLENRPREPSFALDDLCLESSLDTNMKVSEYNMSLEDIGKELGITKMRVCQIIQKALNKIKKRMIHLEYNPNLFD